MSFGSPSNQPELDNSPRSLFPKKKKLKQFLRKSKILTHFFVFYFYVPMNKFVPGGLSLNMPVKGCRKCITTSRRDLRTSLNRSRPALSTRQSVWSTLGKISKSGKSQKWPAKEKFLKV